MGITSRSSARIILLEQLPGKDPEESTAEASLIMWPATSVEGIFNEVEWKCRTAEDIASAMSSAAQPNPGST